MHTDHLLGNDRIQLDSNSPRLAPPHNIKHMLNMSRLPLFGTLMLEIRLYIKRIARNSHNIKILAILVEPLFGNLGTIGNDGIRLDFELFLTKLEDFANVGWVHEWLAAADVEFAHTSVCECSESFLGLV